MVFAKPFFKITASKESYYWACEASEADALWKITRI